MKQRPQSLDCARKNAQPMQVRQVSVDQPAEPESIDFGRTRGFLLDDKYTTMSPNTPSISDSPNKDPPMPMFSEPSEDLYRRLSELLTTSQSKVLSLCKGVEADTRSKVLDEFAQLSNAVWDAVFRQRSRGEFNGQVREWMRKALKLEEEKRLAETHFKDNIAKATESLRDQLQRCEAEIGLLQETNAYLEEQNRTLSEQLRTEVKKEERARPAVRKLVKELSESIPKALAIARDLSLESSASSDAKHSRHSSTSFQKGKLSPVPTATRKVQLAKDRSVSPSDRQIHALKTEMDRLREQLRKSQQERDMLKAWKESYQRNPPKLSNAIHQFEQDTEHERKKLTGKALILQHKLNAVILCVQKFIRVSSGLLRLARDREQISSFEDARAEVDMLIRDIQRDDPKAGKTTQSIGSTPLGGSPTRINSAWMTPEKKENDGFTRALERENRSLDEKLAVERKRADTFAEALELTQKTVERISGTAQNPVAFMHSQDHTIREQKDQLRAVADELDRNRQLLFTQTEQFTVAKTASESEQKRLMEMIESLRREKGISSDQVQLLRASNNRLMQDLVSARTEAKDACAVLRSEFGNILAQIVTTERLLTEKIASKDEALTRLKDAVTNRLLEYERTLIAINSVIGGSENTAEVERLREEKRLLEFTLAQNQQWSQEKIDNAQEELDQATAIIGELRMELTAKDSQLAELAKLQETVKELTTTTHNSAILARSYDTVKAELDALKCAHSQAETELSEVQYENERVVAKNAELVDTAQTKASELEAMQEEFARTVAEANKRIEEMETEKRRLAISNQSLSEEVESLQKQLESSAEVASMLKASHEAALKQAKEGLSSDLSRKREKLKAAKSQGNTQIEKLAMELKLLEEEKKRCDEEKNREIEEIKRELEGTQDDLDKERVKTALLTSELTAAKAHAQEYSRRAEVLALNNRAAAEAIERQLAGRLQLSNKMREEGFQKVRDTLSENVIKVKEMEEYLQEVAKERDEAVAQGQKWQEGNALLEAEVQSLSEDLSSSQNSRTSLQATLDRQSLEVQRLHTENRELSERLEKLIADVKAQQRDSSKTAVINDLQRQLEEKDEELQLKGVKEVAFRREIEKMREDAQNAQKSLEVARTEKSSAEERETRAKKAAEDLSQKVHALTEEHKKSLSNLHSELSAKQSELSSERHSLQSLQVEVAQLYESLAEMNELKSSFQLMEDRLRRLETENGQKDAAIAELEKRKLALETDSLDLQKTVKDRNHEIEKIQTEAKLAKEDAAKLQQTVEQLNAMLKTAHGDIQQHRTTCEQLQAQLSAAQDEYQRRSQVATSEVETLQREIEAREENIKSLRQEHSSVVEALRTETAELVQKLENKETVLAGANQDLAAAKELVRKLNAENTQQRDAADRGRREIEALTEALKVKDGQLRETSSAKEALGKELQAAREQSQVEIGAATQHIGKFKGDVAKLAKEVQELQAEVESTKGTLQTTLSDLEKEQVARASLNRVKEDLEKRVQHLAHGLEESNQKLGEEAKQRASQGDQSAKLREDLRRSEQRMGDLQLLHDEIVRELKQVKDTATAKEKELSGSVESNRSEIVSLNASIEELRHSIEELTNSDREKSREIERREGTIKSLQSEVSTLSSELSSKTSEITLLKGQLEDALAKLNRESNNLESAKATIAEVQSRLSAAESQLTVSTSDIKSLNSQLESSKSTSSSLQAKLSETESQLASKKKELLATFQTLAATKRDLENDIQRALAEKTSTEAEKREAERQCKAVSATAAALTEKVKSLEASEAALHADIAIVRERREKEVAELNQKVAALTVETSQWAKNVQELKDSAASMQALLETQQSANSRLQKSLDELHAEKAQIASNFTEIQQKLNQAEQQCRKLQSEKAAAEEKASTLATELTQRTAAIDKSRKEVDALSVTAEKNAAEIADCSARLQAVQAELAKEREMRAETEGNLSEMSARAESAESAAHMSSVGLIETKGLLETAQRQIQKLTIELENAQKKLSEKTGEAAMVYQTLAANKVEFEGEKRRILAEKATLEQETAELSAKCTEVEGRLKESMERGKQGDEKYAVLEAAHNLLLRRVEELVQERKTEGEQYEKRIKSLEETAANRLKEIENLQTELDSMNDTLRTTHSDLEKEREARASLNRVKEDLEKRVQHLAHGLEESNQKLGEEAKQRASQGDQSAKLREDLRRSEQRMGDLQLLHDEIVRELKQVKETAAAKEKELTGSVESNRSEIMSLNASIEELRQSIEVLTSSDREKSREVERREGTIKSLQSEVSTLSSDLSSKNSEITLLKGQLEDALAKLKIESHQCSLYQSRLDQLVKDADESEELIHTLQSAKQLLEQGSAEQQERISALETQLSQSVDIQSDLQHQIKSLMDTRESLTTDIVELQEARKGEKEDARKLASQQSAIIAELTSDLESVKASLKARNDSLEGERSTVSELRELRVTLEREVEALKKEGKLLGDRLQAESKEKAEYSDECSRLQLNLHSSKQQLTELHTQLASLETSNQSCIAHSQQLEAKLATATNDIVTLRTAAVQRETEVTRLKLEVAAKETEIQSLQSSLNAQHLSLSAEIQSTSTSLDTVKREKAAFGEAVEALQREKESREIALSSEIAGLKAQCSMLQLKSEQLARINTALEHYLKSEEDAPSAVARLTQQLESLQKQFSGLSQVYKLIQTENESLEKEKADLIDERDRLLVQVLENEKSASNRSLGQEFVEENGQLLSEVYHEEEQGSSQSLDLGEPREEETLAKEFVQGEMHIVDSEEPIETDPPHEEGEELSSQMKLLRDMMEQLSKFRNPNEDPLTTLQKLLEEYELLKRNPSRFLVPRLQIPSQRDSKESQTSQPNSPTTSQFEEGKVSGRSHNDSSSVSESVLDKSMSAADAADQDTPRQKILPELWKKKVSHEIRQVKTTETSNLRSRIATLEKDLAEERSIHEHLELQNRLLKEEVAEKSRHIKRLEVAETGGEKSPVNIEHLKDVLVKFIMQLPTQY